MTKKRDKCKYPRCRAEPDIMFSDGTGYCDEHFEEYCEGKNKQQNSVDEKVEQAIQGLYPTNLGVSEGLKSKPL